MSTTTPAPVAVTLDDADRVSAVQYVTRYGSTAILVAGALLAAVGYSLHLGAMPDDVGIAIAIAEDSAWLTSHLFLGFGLTLLAAGMLTVLSQVRPGRGAPATIVGIAVTGFGTLVMGLGDMAHGALGYALADQVDPTTSYAIHTAYFETPAILGLNTGPMLTTLGMVVLGIGVLRSRALPHAVGAVIALTPVVVATSFSLELPGFTQGAAFASGFCVFAYATLKGRGLFAPRRETRSA